MKLFCYAFAFGFVFTLVEPLTAASLPSQAGEFNFSSSTYTVTENETLPAPFGPFGVQNPKNVRGALITVTRTKGAKGKALVDYGTVDLGCCFGPGEALPYMDYTPVSGTLIFDDYQMSTNFVVPVFSDGVANSNKALHVFLANPRLATEENSNLMQPPVLGTSSNATLNILEVNFAHAFTFERRNYRVTESAGYAYVDVLLPGGGGGSVVVTPFRGFGFPLQAGSDNADFLSISYPGPVHTDGGSNVQNPADFESSSYVLSFGPGVTRRTFVLPIYDDAGSEFNEDIVLQLTNPSIPLFINPNGALAAITIIDDDPPAGAADREWNPDQVPFTTPAYNQTPGANGTVESVIVQPDGKSIIAGEFTAYDAGSRHGIARINTDGSLDENFNVGAGANAFVATASLFPPTSTNTPGSLIIGGGFTLFDNVPRIGVARLSPNGLLDPAFNPGEGPNGVVRSVVALPSGKVMVGGDFTSFGGLGRNGIVRLREDGTVDPAFDPHGGANGAVWAVLADDSQPAVHIFSSLTGFGAAEFRTNVQLMATSGVITVTFAPACVPDTLHIYYGPDIIFDSGPTNEYHGDTNCDAGNHSGPVTYVIHYGPGPYNDLTFVVNEGSGDPGTVWSLDATIEGGKSGAAIYLAGEFTAVDGKQRSGIARLLPTGDLDTSFAPGLGADGPVYALGLQSDGKLLVGGDFSQIGTIRRNGVARLNLDGSVDLSFDPGFGTDAPVYALALQPDGKPLLGGIFSSFDGVRRLGVARLLTNGTLDTSFMDTAYNQFAGLINDFSFELPNFVNSIALEAQGKVMVAGSFRKLGGNPHPLNGSFKGIWTRQDKTVRYNVARLIGGYTPGPGQVQIASAEAQVDENGGTLSLPLERVNGRLGTIATSVTTADGSATAGADYAPPPENTALIWPEFAYIAPRSIGYIGPIYLSVPILDDGLVEGDETFHVNLGQPVGSLNLGGEYIPLGAARGRAGGTVVIRDNDAPPGIISFVAESYSAKENKGVVDVPVIRTGNLNTTVAVGYSVQDGTAIRGQDYFATNGTLVFRPGETSKNIKITLIDDTLPEGPETILLSLLEVSASGLIGLGSATFTILDNESPMALSLSHGTNGLYELTFSGAPSVLKVEASTNLIHWQEITVLTNQNGSSHFTDWNSTNYPQRFYRTLLQQ